MLSTSQIGGHSRSLFSFSQPLTILSESNTQDSRCESTQNMSTHISAVTVPKKVLKPGATHDAFVINIFYFLVKYQQSNCDHCAQAYETIILYFKLKVVANKNLVKVHGIQI